MKLLSTLIIGASLLAASSAAWCEMPSCDALSATQKQRAQQLFAREHPYDCCDETLAVCLAQRPPCRLAHRLANAICRRVAAGQSDKAIVQALLQRANSVLQTKRAAIDQRGAPVVGGAKAAVMVTVYACGRCPFCAKIVPRLHHEITAGRLKSKVRLTFKPFPIRGHAGAKELGLAFVAAARQGRGWPYLLRAYAGFGRYSAADLSAWAKAVGLADATFTAGMKDPATRAWLVASKKEGLRNGVKATPTFFIDGRRYVGEMSAVELLDVLEEIWERKSGLSHLGGARR